MCSGAIHDSGSRSRAVVVSTTRAVICACARITCCLLRRSLHAYLIDTLTAHGRRDPAPLLA
jgi:hypothetical protein